MGPVAIYNSSGTIGDITGDKQPEITRWAVYNNSGTIGDITGDITAGKRQGRVCVVQQQRHNRRH